MSDTFNKIDFEQQLAGQQALIDLHQQLRVALQEKVIQLQTLSQYAGNPLDTCNDNIERADTEIRLWYTERKLEIETEVHRQLTERCAAQEKEIETNFNESLQRFTALWTRIDNAIDRIGKVRIIQYKGPQFLELIEEIRTQYAEKFCADGKQERVRERKAFAYAQLKLICEDLGKLQ